MFVIFIVLVASPNISDDGKRVLFNPKDVDPDNRSKFKLKKDGTYAYQPTKEFKEYPIVKYLIGARWCKLIFVTVLSKTLI